MQCPMGIPRHIARRASQTPGMKNTMASGKRGGKVSQEFNLCLFSCTSKAFLVLLFKASRHSCTSSCCWGSACGDPVGWAHQPFISTLLRYRAREKPTLWAAHSSCPLQEVAVVSCRGAARSQLPPQNPPLVGPQQQALPPQRSRGEIPQHPGHSQSAAPHAPTVLGANGQAPQRSREQNDLLLPPLLFCKQGSLYS